MKNKNEPAKGIPSHPGNDPDNGKRLKPFQSEPLPVQTPKPETDKPREIERNVPKRVGG